MYIAERLPAIVKRSPKGVHAAKGSSLWIYRIGWRTHDQKILSVIQCKYFMQDNFHGRYNESEYEMSDFWATNFTANLFGVSNSGYSVPMEGRASLEVDTMEEAYFPVSARACSHCDVTLSALGQ